MNIAALSIGVMGSGAIGCFVGGRLVGAGARVTFVGRERGRAEIAAHGMTLRDLDGADEALAPSRIDFTTDAAALAACDVVLVAVKSAQTQGTARALAPILEPGTLVISMQNGLRNAGVLRAALPAQHVLAGVVGFNVVATGGGVFARATTGPLVIEWRDDTRLAALAAALRAARFDAELAKDIEAKQWSKLVMNLNNAVSALSGAPTTALLFEPGYRRIVRSVVVEALAVFARAHVRTARLGPLPPRLFPMLLALPTPVLKVAARAQLEIDESARSSMWQDLTSGRLTEVDDLNGEIVRLAESCGAAAPLNHRLVALVHEAERRAAGSPNLSAAELTARLASPND